MMSEMVERVATALYKTRSEQDKPPCTIPWVEITECFPKLTESYRELARAAIEAYDEALRDHQNAEPPSPKPIESHP